MKVRHSRFSVGVILFALAMLPTMAQERAAQIREKLLNRNLHSVIVVSHRADWRNFPENSLEAIESAIRMGVDVVELDLQRTKDGKLILMHANRNVLIESIVRRPGRVRSRIGRSILLKHCG